MRPFCKVREFTLSHIYLSFYIDFYLNFSSGFMVLLMFILNFCELMFPVILNAVVSLIVHRLKTAPSIY
uniref:Uncharacterized protein n=1 Tax=Populus trichocarpa TaxID=3694 RepID=A0A2K2AAI4_POPTR